MNDGLYTDLTIEDYHSNRTHLSATQIKLAKHSLKELDWTLRGLIKREGATHFDFGNAFELALLDKNAFAEKVCIKPDQQWVDEAVTQDETLTKPRASGYYQKKNREFLLGREQKYIINDQGDQSWETIQAMLESCFADKVIQGLIKNTEYQLSVFWTDENTGLRLKTRPDICKRKKNVIINVKTTEDGSPKGFAKDLVKYDYPIQACHEITGCMQSGVIESIDNYFWLVVEKKAPFNATVYDFDQEDLKMGMDELHYLYNRIKKANDQNLFPGYSDRSDNEYGILRAPIPMYYRGF
jgi:hypothetical protein